MGIGCWGKRSLRSLALAAVLLLSPGAGLSQEKPGVPCGEQLATSPRPSATATRWLTLNERAAQAGLRIRFARPDEGEAIFRFLTAIRTEVRGAEKAYQTYHRPEDVDYDLYIMAQYYHAPPPARTGELLLIVDAKNSIVGTGGFAWLNEETAEIRKMYLSPTLRGKGLGSALLDYLMARAEAMGARALQLNTQPEMVEALALYLSRGFQWLRTTPQRITYRLELGTSGTPN